MREPSYSLTSAAGKGNEMSDFGEKAFVALAVRLHHGLRDIKGDDVPLFERFILKGWATGDLTGDSGYSNAMLLPVCYQALNLTLDMLVSTNDR